MKPDITDENNSYIDIIKEQTIRALWEVKNVIDCIPEDLWNKEYGDMQMWKHVYHMLHSLDLWFINPNDKNYKEPDIHVENLHNLDVVSQKNLAQQEINSYFNNIDAKIRDYLEPLTETELLQKPAGCKYSRFTLILAQHRHLHTHMGNIMGFIIHDANKWPKVIGLEGSIPEGDFDKFY